MPQPEAGLPDLDPLSALIRETTLKATRDSVGPLIEEIGHDLRAGIREILDRMEVPHRGTHELLTIRETAELLKVDPKTVRRWIEDGLLPPPVRLGGTVRLRRDDLEERLKVAAVDEETGA